MDSANSADSAVDAGRTGAGVAASAGVADYLEVAAEA